MWEHIINCHIIGNTADTLKSVACLICVSAFTLFMKGLKICFLTYMSNTHSIDLQILYYPVCFHQCWHRLRVGDSLLIHIGLMCLEWFSPNQKYMHIISSQEVCIHAQHILHIKLVIFPGRTFASLIILLPSKSITQAFFQWWIKHRCK